MDKKTWIATIIYSYLLAIILLFYSPIALHFNLRDVVWGVFVGGGIYFLCKILGYFLYKKKNIMTVSSSLKKIEWHNLNMYLPLLVFIPSTIVEEILLRSYILSLSMTYLPVYVSVSINAALFYLIHFDKRLIELIISAVIYCLLILITENVLPSILAHITYNIITYLLSNPNIRYNRKY